MLHTCRLSLFISEKSTIEKWSTIDRVFRSTARPPLSHLFSNLFIAFRVFDPALSFVIVGSIVRHGSSRVRQVPSKQTGPVFTHKIVFLWLPTTNSVSLVWIKQWSRSPCTTHALSHLTFSPSLSRSLSLLFSLRVDCCRWQCINQEDDCTHQRRCIEWNREQGDERASRVPGPFPEEFRERD